MSAAEVEDTIMKQATGLEDEATDDKLKGADDAVAALLKEDGEGGEGGEGDEGDEDGESADGQKKKKKPPEPVKIPLAEDFERHAKWKPEPFPESENFATLWAEIRANHAELAETEIRGVLEKHVSAGQWPSGKLQITSRAALALRKAANAAKQAEKDRADTAASEATKRSEEKKKQLEALRGALAVAMTSALMAPESLDKPMAERINAGLEASKTVWREWAPKVQSWKPKAASAAVDIAISQGIPAADAQAILGECAAEPTKSDMGSPSVKKRKPQSSGADEVDESLVTPVKPDSAASDAASPSAPSQSHAHKKAKQAGAKLSPTAVEAAPVEA